MTKADLVSVMFDFSASDVVRFDNTYSWTRSKKLFYLIEVLEPDTEAPIPEPSLKNSPVEELQVEDSLS